MKNSFIHLQDAFDNHEAWFGHHRWDRVGYCLTGQGAMEHATNISYPVSITNGSLTYETTMAHELAHHWFGDQITCARAEEMYLNEGFAEYISYLFLERVYDRTREPPRNGVPQPPP
jgi:aminopeptidase N